jgi:aerobic-type carbon monoxide dehydrogenase small subunit (CoxS/CutS family)
MSASIDCPAPNLKKALISFHEQVLTDGRMKISRRGLLKLVVSGVAAAAGGIGALLLGTQEGRQELASVLHPALPLAWKDTTINVNGSLTQVKVKPNWTLLKVLREDLKLTGTKSGCLNSECGACTVLLDDMPVYACHRLAIEADGHRVTTVEGISSGGELSTLQKAFVDEGAFQCGYCAPGFVMTATALLRSNPSPSESQVVEALSGNVCRCCNYVHITKAVLAAAQKS